MPQAAVDLPGTPSPPPPCCEHDRSGGVRARVTVQAIRRYGSRNLGMEEALDGLDDVEAVDAMQAAGVPIGTLRRWLAFYGGVGVRHGAVGVCRDGVELVLPGGRVVAVVSKRGERRREKRA